MTKAIFFDRDGIVNRKLENDYVKSIDEFEFIEDFFELFDLCNRNHFLSILVTNQQCIGKKIITEHQLTVIHDYMQYILKERVGKGFDAIYFSPDLADTGSLTRKPEAGMFFNAIKQYDIVADQSWTIGDAITDVVAGKKACTNTLLIGDYSNVSDADIILPTIKDAYYFFYNLFNN
ncbi:MAG: HAD-IIIA family hydrolase [Bacteroidetes bacterium]|nr:HAD-IIIA family hydrolase [Bacteroidota bacterium]